MKSILAALFCAIACCTMSLHVSAATYVDDMAELWNNSFKNYQHLSFPQNPGVLANMADNTALSFASGSSPSAWADYRVMGADTISVKLYSNAGTFVHPFGEAYAMGITDDNVAGLAGQQFSRALYSPSSQSVYAMVGGVLYQAHSDKNRRYVFAPTSAAPVDLTGYGVNVFVSATGSDYRRLPLTYQQISYTQGQAFCSEILSAEIPRDAAFIRVELNDVSRFPRLDQPGEFEDKAYIFYNALASVTLTGDRMIFGIPSPVITQPRPTEPTEPTEPEEPTERSSFSRASSARPSPSSRASSAASTPSSKFTGVVTPTVPGEKFTLSITAPSSEPKESARQEEPREPPPSQEQQAATTPLTYEQPSAVVYQIGGESNGLPGGDASGWMMAYIAVLSGAVLVVLVKPGGPRKG